jgi:hypothetical protein
MMKRPAWSQDLARFLSEVGAYMVIAARPAEFGILLAIGVGFAPLMAESAPAIKPSAPAAPADPIGAALVPLVDLAKMMPGAAVQTMLAQADDLAHLHPPMLL